MKMICQECGKKLTNERDAYGHDCEVGLKKPKQNECVECGFKTDKHRCPKCKGFTQMNSELMSGEQIAENRAEMKLAGVKEHLEEWERKKLKKVI